MLQIRNVVKLRKAERWKTRAKRPKVERWRIGAERYKGEWWKMGLSAIQFVKSGTKR